MSSGNSSSFSMPQNQEKKQIPRYEVRFTNKNHPFMWLVCKTRAKILLSDPETSLTTPRLLPLRRSRRSYGNYQSPQSSGSSRNILKRLGRSGRSRRSYGNQARPGLKTGMDFRDLVWKRVWKITFFGLKSGTRNSQEYPPGNSNRCDRDEKWCECFEVNHTGIPSRSFKPWRWTVPAKENTFSFTFWQTESVTFSLSDLLCKSGVRL